MDLVLIAAILATILAAAAAAGLASSLSATLGFRFRTGDLADRANRREQDMHDSDRRLGPASSPKDDSD